LGRVLDFWGLGRAIKGVKKFLIIGWKEGKRGFGRKDVANFQERKGFGKGFKILCGGKNLFHSWLKGFLLNGTWEGLLGQLGRG